MAHLAYVCGNRSDFRGPQGGQDGLHSTPGGVCGGPGKGKKKAESKLGQSWAWGKLGLVGILNTPCARQAGGGGFNRFAHSAGPDL